MVIFKFISTLLSIYLLLCFLRIISTFARRTFGRVAEILGIICDPYIDRFCGIKIFCFGRFDLGPAISLCVLQLLSRIFLSLSRGYISPLMIAESFIEPVYSIVSSILFFLTILFVIRLVLLILRPQNPRRIPGFLENQFDISVAFLAHKISQFFTRGNPITYKSELIISTAVLIIIQIILNLVFLFFISR
ncbi:YggT family protein [Treponema sp.]|uniref:YggT family protein n=1 Tax=Treponema sp. TaxID=166 RepID=UPI003F0F61A2